MDDEDFAKLELIDGKGGDASEHRVTHDSRRWYFKCLASAEVASKELLAYRLSSGIGNVAEVRRVTPEMEIADSTERPVHAPGCNAIIVRLVQDYSLGELTLKAMDEAVASELVYTTWIRRRDAYVANMGYVDGVPMFFDHHIAFDEYGEAQTASEFFRRHDNGGYAGT
jgi:hypothetical protein